MGFKDFLKTHKKEKAITIFYDIETFQYNEKEGQEKPSQYKNMLFTFAISYFNGEDLEVEIYNTFKEFLDDIFTVYNSGKTPTIYLNAHNGNRYDNHFLRWELRYYYPNMLVKNYNLDNAEDIANVEAVNLKDLSKEEKQNGVILEKRIKTKNNVEMTFFLNRVKFSTVDNFMKTNTSIKDIGNRLLSNGLITEDHLKTDFDYLKYNRNDDMTDEQAKHYTESIFKDLTEQEIRYIENDVIILAMGVKHYSTLFYGFDYSKITFTTNIKERYLQNQLTSYQLLNEVKDGKNKLKINYTDYEFRGENLYSYLRPFYRGGLNIYNDKLIGKIIEGNITAIDINSSYPYAMHNFKIPTFIKDFTSHDKPTMQHLNESDFQLIQMTKKDYDKYIINKLKSDVLKSIFVKYYTTPLSDYININSYTIKILNDFFDFEITKLPVLSTITFESVYFGARDEISHNYWIKTQGKSNVKLNYYSPYDIQETDEPNDEAFTKEQVDGSKVLLNGLYGIPALRPYFNLFRYQSETDDYINFRNGYKNNERNIVFSIFVTAVSFWNLLSPFQFINQRQIDDVFIYADTDSLYLKEKGFKHIPDYFFHDKHLGKWGVDESNINQMIVLNHKKYAYEVDGKIKVKSAGLPNDSFNYAMDFQSFVKTQFKHGTVIHNQKSIMNEQGTISIYQSKTLIEQGITYPKQSLDIDSLIGLGSIIHNIRQQDISLEDALYIETPFGNLSMMDIYPKEEDPNQSGLKFLMLKQQSIRQFLENELE